MNYAAMAQALRSERRELLAASVELGDTQSALTLAMLTIEDCFRDSHRAAVEYMTAAIDAAKVIANMARLLGEVQQAPKFPSGGIRSRRGRAAEYIVPKHLRR